MPEPAVLRRRSWSHAEDAELRRLFGTVSMAEIAGALGREEAQVRRHAGTLGLMPRLPLGRRCGVCGGLAVRAVVVRKAGGSQKTIYRCPVCLKENP